MATLGEKMGFTSNSEQFGILGLTPQKSINTQGQADKFHGKGDKYANTYEETLEFCVNIKKNDILFDNLIQSVHIIMIQKSGKIWQILMIHNKYTNKWLLPGGKKESVNETDNECIKREFKEETGMELSDETIGQCKQFVLTEHVNYEDENKIIPVTKKGLFLYVVLREGITYDK